MRLILILVLSSSLLTACASLEPQVVVKHKLVYIPIFCPEVMDIAELYTRKVLPVSIKDEFGAYWVGLSGKDYENLAYNMQEFLRVIRDQQGNIRYYQRCILDFNEALYAREVEELTLELEE